MSEILTNKQLCKQLGIKRFTTFQNDVIHSLTARQNVIGLTRTGDGKTICYLSQVLNHPYETMLVITPTISLMLDQVRQCAKYNIHAACLYHRNPENEIILDHLQQGKIQVLFLSPERLSNHDLRSSLSDITIHTVVVDEVHCLLEWGNEFRPMYRRIGSFIRNLKTKPVIAAFSATVSYDDIPRIADSLGMTTYQQHIGTIKRDNLKIKKRLVKTDAERYEKVKNAVRKLGAAERAVIYCTRICDVEQMYEYLVTECDISSSKLALCHSKLTDRAKQEQRFISGKARIMVATSAFGMGVHIPDIRLVIVSQLPFSIAAFYQMAGRAGRDGKPAKVLLLYNSNDFTTNLDIISAKDENAVKSADALYDICQSADHLHSSIIRYLGGKAGV